MTLRNTRTDNSDPNCTDGGREPGGAVSALLLLVWIIGGACLVAILALALILLAHGDGGLGFVLLGLGLMQGMVMVMLAWRPASRDRRADPGLSAAE